MSYKTGLARASYQCLSSTGKPQIACSHKPCTFLSHWHPQHCQLQVEWSRREDCHCSPCSYQGSAQRTACALHASGTASHHPPQVITSLHQPLSSDMLPFGLVLTCTCDRAALWWGHQKVMVARDLRKSCIRPCQVLSIIKDGSQAPCRPSVLPTRFTSSLHLLGNNHVEEAPGLIVLPPNNSGCSLHN